MPETFDYSAIPLGYYDRIFHGPAGVRRLWHVSKFERVLDCLPARGEALLDVGCFAGTFLSTVPAERFSRQLGVDILPDQIDYARRRYGTSFRQYDTLPLADLEAASFDCVTLIEVIEHLRPAQISTLLDDVARVLRPRGLFVLTTPNYGSAWPLLEACVDRVSDVRYEEQHVTRFSYWGLARQLRAVWPAVDRYFDFVDKTTTHFATPFLAAASYRGARWLSRLLPHRNWKNPFGHLVLAQLRRR